MKELLSPKELAAAIGVSSSSIKRWADEGRIQVTRTAGGHRRITMAEASRFVREAGVEVIQPEMLGLPGSSRVGRGFQDLDVAAHELEEHLRLGASEASQGLIQSLYLSGVEVADIADGPICRALSSLGEIYQDDTDGGILIEHRATQICLQAVLHLRSLIKEPRNGPVAIGGAPPGDPYQLPTQLVAAVLATAGFHTVNLGPETPLSTFDRSVELMSPRLVWLSVTAPPSDPKLGEGIAALAERLCQRGATIAVGGRESHRLGLKSCSAFFIGRSMSELLAFARGLAIAHSDHAGDV